MLILPFIAFTGFSLVQGTLTWSIVGATSATLAAMFGGYFVLRDWRLARRLKDPLHVTYLIPMREYPEVLFEGASEEQGTPEMLTVGVGVYRIMHQIYFKTEVGVGPVVLRFSGPSLNKPRPEGSDNPFIVEIVPVHSSQNTFQQVRDWWGDVHPIVSAWPRHFIVGEPWVIGNRITTYGPWEGMLELSFPIYGGKTIQKSLPFRVTDDPAGDNIPFLKGSSPSLNGVS